MTMQIVGMEETLELFKDAAPNMVRNLVRSTIHGIATDLGKQIKSDTPVEHGDLKASVKAKRLRSNKNKNFIASAVVIDDKTPPSKNSGAEKFTWLHVEYGTQAAKPHPFVMPAARAHNQTSGPLLQKVIVDKMQKMLKAKQKKVAKAGR
ncbi:MAG: hypothetical protein V4493_12340 [Pseudomonadota bacterium]